MDAARRSCGDEPVFTDVDPDVSHPGTGGIEEDQVTFLQMAAVPEAPVARSSAESELVCRRMWEIGAMCEVCPTREAGAVKTIRRTPAVRIVNSQLALGAALDVKAFSAEVVQGMRCGWAACDQDQRPQEYGGHMLQKPRTQSATRDSHLLIRCAAGDMTMPGSLPAPGDPRQGLGYVLGGKARKNNDEFCGRSPKLSERLSVKGL